MTNILKDLKNKSSFIDDIGENNLPKNIGIFKENYFRKTKICYNKNRQT